MLTFEKFVRGRCSLISSLNNLPSGPLNWKEVKSQLDLSEEEQDHLHKLAVRLNIENGTSFRGQYYLQKCYKLKHNNCYLMDFKV